MINYTISVLDNERHAAEWVTKPVVIQNKSELLSEVTIDQYLMEGVSTFRVFHIIVCIIAAKSVKASRFKYISGCWKYIQIG